MSTHALITRRIAPILVVALTLAATSVASAATPSWYPQLRLAVVDTGDAGTAIGACAAPRATSPKAGRSCAIVRASEESDDLNRVSTFAEIGEDTGPCRRLLVKLDQAALSAAAKALTFATSRPTMAQDVSGRRALARAATLVTADFAALRHCVGK